MSLMKDRRNENSSPNGDGILRPKNEEAAGYNQPVHFLPRLGEHLTYSQIRTPRLPLRSHWGYFVANLVYGGGGLEIGIYFSKICERVTSHMGIHEGRLSSLFGD